MTRKSNKRPSLEGKLRLLRRLLDEHLQRTYPRAQASGIDQSDGSVVRKALWTEHPGRAKPLGAQNAATIILVVHEATHTGAPKTALELGHGLSETFRIIFVIMRTGPRLQDFINHSDLVLVPDKGADVGKMIDALAAQVRIKAAILNSITTGDYAPFFLQRKIPTLCYVHEFAQTVPRQTAEIAFSQSTELIFSSDVTFRSYPNLQNRSPLFIPQGLREIGSGARGGSAVLEKLQQDLATKVIVGSGTGLLRKGVDFFIETCRKLKELEPDIPMVFLWLGAPWDARDLGVAALFRAQIEQSSLSDCFWVVPDADTGAFLQRADLVLLTSRLDPLPNVALEAMILETPVLAFTKTSGIPDLVEMDESLTAKPFDTQELADKARLLLIDPNRALRVGRMLSLRAKEVTQFEPYVRRFASAIEKASDSFEDYETKSKKLSALAKERGPDLSPKDITFQQFALAQSTGNPTEPLAGFSSRIFSMYRHGISPGPDGVLAYLKEGLPEGPWRYTRIFRKKAPAPIGLSRTLLHIHSHQTEGLQELLNIVQPLSSEVRMVITCPEDAFQSHQTMANSILFGAEFEVVPVRNFGRNFGALRQLAFKDKLGKIDYLCHVHNKKSPHVDRKVVAAWRSDLFLGLIERQMFHSIVGALELDDQLGIVYPEARSLVGWHRNLEISTDVGRSLGLQSLPKQPDCPVGGMFFSRAAPMRKILRVPSLAPIKKSEPIATDGEYVHALERLLPLLMLNQGFKIGKSVDPLPF